MLLLIIIGWCSWVENCLFGLWMVCNSGCVGLVGVVFGFIFMYGVMWCYNCMNECVF